MGFGLTERESLDTIIELVPSNTSRKDLIPIIDKYCLDGTIFCSDGWKAYDKLKNHPQLDEYLHFLVIFNHSKITLTPKPVHVPRQSRECGTIVNHFCLPLD